MSVLMLDFNNLAIRSIFMDKEMINNPTPDWGLHKHTLLQSIFFNIRKFQPTEVILAVDDNNCWRKKIYSEYKAHRKDKKDKDIFPWDEFYTYLNPFLAEIRATFPFYVLQVPYSEADDVIAVLAKHIPHEKVVVTADSDYIQLLSIPNLKLYNPLKEKFVIDATPKQTLMIKILSGDSGDNIPNVKPRLGPKTAEKLIINNEVESYIMDNNLQENFDRNVKLIDWNYIPMVIQSKILDMYSKYKISDHINNNELFNFLVRNKLRQHTEDISIIKQSMKPLIDSMRNKDFMKFCEEN